MTESAQPLRAVPNETFASMLRRRRAEERLSQGDLGSRLRTRQQTIAAWEHGQRPQQRFLPDLVEFLELDSVQYLLELLDFSAPVQGRLAAASPRSTLTADEARRSAMLRVVEGYAAKIERGAEMSDRDMDLFERALSILADS